MTVMILDINNVLGATEKGVERITLDGRNLFAFSNLFTFSNLSPFLYIWHSNAETITPIRGGVVVFLSPRPSNPCQRGSM
jgi:hypothetical protein